MIQYSGTGDVWVEYNTKGQNFSGEVKIFLGGGGVLNTGNLKIGQNKSLNKSNLNYG